MCSSTEAEHVLAAAARMCVHPLQQQQQFKRAGVGVLWGERGASAYLNNRTTGETAAETRFMSVNVPADDAVDDWWSD